MTREQREREGEQTDDLRGRCDVCGDGAHVPALVDGRFVDVWHCQCTDGAARTQAWLDGAP